MTQIEQLQLIAEISAAFLGFIAVFIALSNEEGRFSASDRHFIQGLVLSSAFALFVSFAPSTLALYLESRVAWVYSLWIAIVGGTITAALMGWEQWHMPPEESVKVNVLWHVPPWLIGTVMFALPLHALYTGTNIEGAFIATLTLSIPLSLWCFIAIVFRRFF